jgi:hypothetical protein
MLRAVQTLIVLILFPIILGCSGAHNPVQPDQRPPTSPAPCYASGRTLWGLWTVSIDPDSGIAEVIPARTAGLHLNAVRMLEVSPCKYCLQISNPRLINEHEVEANLRLTHPYPSALKLSAFDVRGVFISGADFTLPESERSISLDGDSPRLVNPDGYTELFNPTDFPSTLPAIFGYIEGKYSTGGDLSATLNPFIAYETDQPRRMFRSGYAHTQRVRIFIPSTPIEFGYAVDACWQLADEVHDPIEDFPPDANCLEAYRVNVTIGDGLNISNGVETEITAEIFDHQGLDTISSVTAEAPDLFDGVIDLSLSQQTGDESWLYEGVLTKSHDVPVGGYPVLVRVTDRSPDPNLGRIDAWQVSSAWVGHGIGWARAWGGLEDDVSESVAVDNSGNSYVVGAFRDVVDFDPGPGTDLHASIGDEDAYLSKFSPNGDFLWARTWGGTGHDTAHDVALEVDFDPGPGTDPHSGTDDIYLTKYDSDGNFVWARSWGGSSGLQRGDDSGNAIAVDYSDCIYVTGDFEFILDFDPGPGQDYHSSNGGRDIFLLKLDSDGNFVWADTWGGDAGWTFWDQGTDITLDAAGNPFVVGMFGDNVDFDPGSEQDTRHSNGKFDCFLAKFDSLGSYRWARTWGGTGDDRAFMVTIDANRRSFVTGDFSFSVDFDPGPGEEILVCNGDSDAFISCFDQDGDFLWAGSWGSPDNETYAFGLALDSSGNPYVSGGFGGEVDFDPGPDDATVASIGMQDCYLSRFDASGNHVWVRTWGGTDSDAAARIAITESDRLYISGFFSGLSDLDPGPGINNISSFGEGDAFLLKLGPDGYR